MVQEHNDVEVSIQYALDCVNELEHAVGAIRGVINEFKKQGVKTIPMPHPFNFPIKQERIKGGLYNTPKFLISAGCDIRVDPCEYIDQIITLLLSLCSGIRRTPKRL